MTSVPHPAPMTVGHAPRLSAVVGHLGWRHEVLRMALVYVLYEALRIVPSPHLMSAEADSRAVLRLEARVHLAPERWLNSHLAAAPDGFGVAAAYYYEILHYSITPLVLVWMFRAHRTVYARARNSLVAMTVPSLVVFWLFPVVPPRLLPGRPFHDIVAEQHRWGWWSASGTAPHGLGQMVNDVAAMPSLHVGWALWCAVQLVRHARPPAVRVVGACYPVLTAIVVMSTGNHYLADTVGGTAVAVLGEITAAAVNRHHAQHSSPPAGPESRDGRYHPDRHSVSATINALRMCRWKPAWSCRADRPARSSTDAAWCAGPDPCGRSRRKLPTEPLSTPLTFGRFSTSLAGPSVWVGCAGPRVPPSGFSDPAGPSRRPVRRRHR